MVETWLSMPVGEDLLFDRSLLLGGALGELSSMKIRKVDEKMHGEWIKVRSLTLHKKEVYA